MIRWPAVLCLAVLACEADPDATEEQLAAAAEPGVERTPAPSANPLAPQVGSGGFRSQAAESEPFDPPGFGDMQPDRQATNPFEPGSRGEEDEEEDVPGLAGLTFFGCSCLTPGDIVPSVWFWACASNGAEAALMSWKKLPCILKTRCFACVCYPGPTCFAKG